MKITIINAKSTAKPQGWCPDVVDLPPMDIKK